MKPRRAIHIVAAFLVGASVSFLVQSLAIRTVTEVAVIAAIATGLVAVIVVDLAHRHRMNSNR